MVQQGNDPGTSAPLSGREAELRVLLGALGDAAATGRLVLFSGDAGVGKSRLVREVADRARISGARVAFGAAYEVADGRPFGPIVDLLRSSGAGATPEVRSATTAAIRLLSSTTEAAPNRWAQVDAITEALQVASEAETPLRLLALEDLHWADVSTLEVLIQVLRQASDIPALVLATFRPPQPDAQALLGFAGAMRQLHHCQRIDLGPIQQEASEALVRSVLGASADPTEVARIVQRGDGNPFFLEEAARDAARATRNGRPTPLVPTAVRELVQRRVVLLPPEARAVVDALAVLGEPAGTPRLAGLLGLTEDQTATALAPVLIEDLIERQPDGRFGFRHALTRDAVYESIAVARQRELHTACVRLLDREEGDDQAAATARHLLAIGGVEAERRAGELLAVAGDSARSRQAHEQAAEFYARAVELLEHTHAPEDVRLRARLRMADAVGRGQADDRALSAFEALANDAARAGDASVEAEAALGYEAVYLATGRARNGSDARSVPLLERALRHLEERGPLDSLAARLLAAQAQARYFAGQHEAALANAERAVEVAQASRDPGAEAAALNTMRAATWTPDRAPELLSLCEAIIDRAALANDLDLELEGLWWSVPLLIQTGQRARADMVVRRFGVLAEQWRQPRRLAEWHRLHAMFLQMDGDLDGALAESELAAALGERAGNLEARIAHSAMILATRGDAERRPAARRALDVLIGLATTPTRQLAVIAFMVAAGDRDDAVRVATDLLTRWPVEDDVRDHLWLTMRAMFAQHVVELGHPEWVRWTYDELLPYADCYISNSNAVCYGSVEFLLGRLAAALDDPRAEAHLRRGEERNRAFGVRLTLGAGSTPSERVTRTFMFTDIVKSTDLAGAMGDEAWDHVLRWHNEMLADQFRAFHGELVVSTGDGFFVAFDTSAEAIDCAIAIQRTLADHRQRSGFAPSVRIGVHRAQASGVDGNYHGLGVHEAARISALAGGGEIVASVVSAEGRARTGEPWAAILKGLPEPVQVVLLAWQ